MTLPGDDTAVVAAMLCLVPVADCAKAELLRLMNGGDRHYHDTRHLAALWRRHLALCAGTGMDTSPWPRLIAAAIGWHDAVYVPGRTDNERESAALWRVAARGGGLTSAEIDWVATAIAATAEHGMPRPPSDTIEERALLWVLDLDLTPLGEPPAQFARARSLLTAEFVAAGAGNRGAARLTFLRRMAACPQIYRSPVIAAVYEAQARENIAQELR